MTALTLLQDHDRLNEVFLAIAFPFGKGSGWDTAIDAFRDEGFPSTSVNAVIAVQCIFQHFIWCHRDVSAWHWPDRRLLVREDVER